MKFQQVTCGPPVNKLCEIFVKSGNVSLKLDPFFVMETHRASGSVKLDAQESQALGWRHEFVGTYGEA